MCFQGEVEVRQINGHSSEEEKDEEEKEPWPDDHSSSRWDTVYDTHLSYHISSRYMRMSYANVNLNTSRQICVLNLVPVMYLQRLLQRLLWLDGGRRDQPWTAQEECESEEEKQRLWGRRREEEGWEEGKKERQSRQRRRFTKEDEAKGEEEGLSSVMAFDKIAISYFWLQEWRHCDSHKHFKGSFAIFFAHLMKKWKYGENEVWKQIRTNY